MHRDTEKFVHFCLEHLDFTQRQEDHYQSLAICVVDCVYSLRARYESVTEPVVKRYADRYMDGDRNAPGCTAAMLARQIDEAGGPDAFAETVLKNRQRLSGRSKAAVCYDVARALADHGINTLEDFNAADPKRLEGHILGVRGIGDAGANYLFMLAGDPKRCKPDVHIHHSIRDACGEAVSNEECQIIFTEAVEKMRTRYPDLTVKALDGIVWRKYASHTPGRRSPGR